MSSRRKMQAKRHSSRKVIIRMKGARYNRRMTRGQR